MFDVVIVSVFGRGHWLAAELSQRPIKVGLLDFSENLGRWSPEDWEGPFGVLRDEVLTHSQVARLGEEDYQEPVERGFCVWTSEGPSDSMGLLSAHMLEKDIIWNRAREYWREYAGAQTTDSQHQVQQRWGAEPFQNNWLIHLSHQLASHCYVENSQAIHYGRPLSIFSPMSVRRNSRRGFHQSVESCRSRGVEVFAKSSLEDLISESREISGIEIKGEWSGALKSRYYIWLLSSEETHKLSPRVGEKLFAKGPLQPQWVWLRYRIRLDVGRYADVVPNHMVLLNSVNLPWVNENMLILQRSLNIAEWDVWVRAAHLHRFHRAHLDELGEKICGHLSHKWRGASVEIIQKPQEHSYEYADLGPSLWPVYQADQVVEKRGASLRNISYGGPENWLNLDWVSRFAADEKCLSEYQSWYQRWLKKQGDKGDRAIHAP